MSPEKSLGPLPTPLGDVDTLLILNSSATWAQATGAQGTGHRDRGRFQAAYGACIACTTSAIH